MRDTQKREKRGRAGAPLPGVPPPSAAPPPQDYGGAQAPRQSTRARTARHPAQPPTPTAKTRWRAVLEARAVLCFEVALLCFEVEARATAKAGYACPSGRGLSTKSAAPPPGAGTQHRAGIEAVTAGNQWIEQAESTAPDQNHRVSLNVQRAKPMAYRCLKARNSPSGGQGCTLHGRPRARAKSCLRRVLLATRRERRG